jgi:hypothetical protein
VRVGETKTEAETWTGTETEAVAGAGDGPVSAEAKKPSNGSAGISTQARVPVRVPAPNPLLAVFLPSRKDGKNCSSENRSPIGGEDGVADGRRDGDAEEPPMDDDGMATLLAMEAAARAHICAGTGTGHDPCSERRCRKFRDQICLCVCLLMQKCACAWPERERVSE